MLTVQKEKYPVFCLNQYFPVNNYDYYESVVNNSIKIGINKIRIELRPDEWYDETARKWNESLYADLSRKFEVLLSVKIDNRFSNIHLLLEQIFSFYEDKIPCLELINTSKTIDTLQLKKILKSARLFNKKLVIPNDLAEDIKLLPQDIISINFKGTENISSKIKKLKKEFNLQVWVTGLTVESEKFDEFSQVNILANIASCGADRVYWNNLIDINKDYISEEDKIFSGLMDSKSVPKIAYRLFEKEGFNGILGFSNILKQNALRQETHEEKMNFKNFEIVNRDKKTVVIFGGSGFIGTNVADKYLTDGCNVRIFDNLSRPGVEENIRWLLSKHGNKIEVEIADIRDRNKVASAVKNASMVFNFAAQVAVTTSFQDPMHDFEVNVKGTINLLESLRNLSSPVPFLFTSSNKVYRVFDDSEIKSEKTRYVPESEQIKSNGISELRPLDFHSPYGCSKGSADQYVLDYCRSYKMPTIVFRMSCIYGPHQFGVEDQGWVTHFLIQAIKNEPINLYGDGKQVRDILFVEDLVRAFQLAQSNISNIAGNAFNIGGGVNNTISLIELIDLINEYSGVQNKPAFGEWRAGDQKYYVSDISKFRRLTGWEPVVSVGSGVAKLYDWLLRNYPFEKKTPSKREVLPDNKALAF